MGQLVCTQKIVNESGRLVCAVSSEHLLVFIMCAPVDREDTC